MNFKIFQSFYKTDQTSFLDKEFEPLDNTENPFPNLCEFYLHRVCYKKAIKENLDIWGLMSWKWKEKIKNLTANNIIDTVLNNQQYDCFLFNPFFKQASICYNVWENGEASHQNILDIIENIFDYLKLDKNFLYYPMSINTTIYCSYVIAKKDFWEEFLTFTDSCFGVIDFLSQNIRNLFNSSAKYPNDMSLNYLSFINERLFSTFINMKNIKCYSYCNKEYDEKVSIYDKLNKIKDDAISSKNKTILKEWIDLRNSKFSLNTDCVHRMFNNFQF